MDFIDWAQHYVDQLDPLSRTPQDPDLEANRSGYSASDDKVEQTLSRLIGRHWQDAWKLGRLAPEPRARTPSSHVFSDPDIGIVFSPSSSADYASDYSDL